MHKNKDVLQARASNRRSKALQKNAEARNLMEDGMLLSHF